MPGRIMADPNAGGRVQVAQAGTISGGPQGLAMVGQRVKKGQVLATLVPALDASSRADKQSALAELEAQSAVLERRLARLTQLEGSVPRKDIEEARIELESLTARRKAMADALGGHISLVAPVSGVVAASEVVVGQVVEAKDVLFEIVDPQRLAVEALAFEALPTGLGQASARLDGQGHYPIQLRFVGAGSSLREQALPVMFRIQPQESGAMPPVAIGQTLKVLAETRDKQAGIAVPVAALVRNSSNELIVWVHERAERFAPRRVKTAPLDAQRVLVLVGLEGKERVVVQGPQSLVQVR
jgi:RND family efflux transporter MFP subunit